MKLSIPIVAIALLLVLAIPISALTRPNSQPELPDLTVEKLDVSNKYPKSGETVTITLWIKNIGTNTSPSFTYELVASDSKFQERGISTNRKFNVLETGAIYKTNLEATVFGPTTLKVVVDRENTVKELDDSNNEKSINVGFEEIITPPVTTEPPVQPQEEPQVLPDIPQQFPPYNVPFQQKEAEKIFSSAVNTLMIIGIIIVAVIIVVVVVVVYLVTRKKPSAPSAAPPQAPPKKAMPKAPKK